MKKRTVREKAHEQILKCKDICYEPYGRNASNELEGDFGRWKDWEDVLVKFAQNIKRSR